MLHHGIVAIGEPTSHYKETRLELDYPVCNPYASKKNFANISAKREIISLHIKQLER